jgi:hypothetical protein
MAVSRRVFQTFDRAVDWGQASLYLTVHFG